MRIARLKKIAPYRSKREVVVSNLLVFLPFFLVGNAITIFPDQLGDRFTGLLLVGVAGLVSLSILGWWFYLGREQFPLRSDAGSVPYVPQSLLRLVEERDAAVIGSSVAGSCVPARDGSHTRELLRTLLTRYRSRGEAVAFGVPFIAAPMVVLISLTVLPQRFDGIGGFLLLALGAAVLWCMLRVLWVCFGRKWFPLPPNTHPGPYLPKRTLKLVEERNTLRARSQAETPDRVC